MVKSIFSLISKIREDHEKICSDIKKIISSKDCIEKKYALVLEIKKLLIEHLTIEDESLYPFLKDMSMSFFNKEFVENSLEMKKIVLDLIDLLNKYAHFKNKKSFEDELSILVNAISQRFKTEENFLAKVLNNKMV